MFDLITAGLLAILLPGTTTDPCAALPVDQVVAIFAEAGHPVTVGEAGGFGDVAAMGWCTYELSDQKGVDLTVSVQVGQVEREDDYTTCNPWGQNDGFRVVAELGDEACVQDGGSALPLFEIVTLNFRNGKRAGQVMLMWEIEEESMGPLRLAIAEKVAHAWMKAIAT